VRVNTSGSKSYQVDLGKIDGKRVRHQRSSKEEALTIAQQARAALLGGGLAPFTVPAHVLSEAQQCSIKLAPYGASLPQAVDYYIEHFLRFREAPTVGEAVDSLISKLVDKKRDKITIKSLRTFLKSKLSGIQSKRLGEVTTA